MGTEAKFGCVCELVCVGSEGAICKTETSIELSDFLRSSASKKKVEVCAHKVVIS